MGIITTGNFPKALWPGVRAWFGDQYDRHVEQWPQLFDRYDSNQAFEEDVLISSFGFAQVKNEAGSITYDTEMQGYVSRYTHVVYALGFIVSWEEIINNQYETVARRRAERLAFSMRQTKETVCAMVFDRAFNSSFPGGDGAPLCSTSHPTRAGNQSNVLSPAVDISETALENLVTMVLTARNDRGFPIALQARKLVVPPQLYFEAVRITQSIRQSGTANNDINAMLWAGMFPDGVVVNNYLTDPDAFFVLTNCPHGTKLYQRVDLQFGQDEEFDTKVLKYAAVDYYSVGWTDWRRVYGCPGA